MRVHREDPRPAAEGLNEPPAARAWDGRSYGGSAGHRFFIASIRLLGAWPTYFFLAWVVFYYCLVARKGTRGSRDYLARVLGPARWPRRFVRTYRHFFEFGQVLVDRFIFYTWGPKSLMVASTGWENIEAGLARGKGVILLSAHVGGWEMATGIRRRFESHQLQVPINIMLYVPPGQGVPSVVGLLERDGDVKVIPVDGTSIPFEVIAALERGEVVAVHGDRPTSDAKTRVPFLGAPAFFPTGPWQLAAATGAAIVPAFLIKDGFRRYRFQTAPPIAVHAPRAERARILDEHIARFADLLASILVAHPYQWFNFYEYWR